MHQATSAGKNTNRRKRIFHSTLFILLFLSASCSHAESLKVCYEADFLIKIGESCVTYDTGSDGVLQFKSVQHTTGIIDVAHHIEQKVMAQLRIDPVASIYLFFYEKNSAKSLTHHYFYKNSMVGYSSNSFRFKDKVYKSVKKDFGAKGVLDPVAAVLSAQLHHVSKGEMTSFFEGKYIDITYKDAGRADVEFEGLKYRCRKVDFKIPVSTSSVVTPTGVWRVYIDEKTGMIMRLELKFPLGSAKLIPVSITGDKDIFRKYISGS